MVVVGAAVVVVVGTAEVRVVPAVVVEVPVVVAGPAVVVVGAAVAGVAGAPVVEADSGAEALHPATTRPNTTMSTTRLDTLPGPVAMLVTEPSYPAACSTHSGRDRSADSLRRTNAGVDGWRRGIQECYPQQV